MSDHFGESFKRYAVIFFVSPKSVMFSLFNLFKILVCLVNGANVDATIRKVIYI